MKKKLTVTLLAVMMVVTSQAAVFADTEVEVAEEKSNTEADQMVSEKIDDAVRVFAGGTATAASGCGIRCL